MNIKHAFIDWHDEFSNPPTLHVVIDAFPDEDQLVYDRRDGLWFAELDGYARFYSHGGGEKNEGGFAGRSYTLTMRDGTQQVLRGPWSSRSSVMNLYFKHTMEVTAHLEREMKPLNLSQWYKRTQQLRDNVGLGYATHFTIERVIEALRMIQGVSLFQITTKDGEIDYRVTKIGFYHGEELKHIIKWDEYAQGGFSR